jgi:hypothetical protein
MDETVRKDTASNDPTPEGQYMIDKGEDPRITRARLSGPEQATKDATVAEMAADGTMTVLVKGTNEWVCTPGNENKIGAPPMCPPFHRTTLDDHVAFRCRGQGASDHSSRQRRLGDVCRNTLLYLHVCGSPWEGNEYLEGDKAVWTMSYAAH